MIVKTRIFKLCNGNYRNLSELAYTMEISVSQVYRVREGKRSINQKFIIGAMKAFPECKFDDLFYFAPESPTITNNYHQGSAEEKQRTEPAVDRAWSFIKVNGSRSRRVSSELCATPRRLEQSRLLSSSQLVLRPVFRSY